MLALSARRLGKLLPATGLQLNKSSPVVANRGLVRFFVLSAGNAGGMQELVNGCGPALGINGTITHRAGHAGPEAYFNGANTNYIEVASGPILGGSADFTIIGLVRRLAAADINGSVFYAERGSSGNDILKLGLGQVGFANTVAFTYRNDAGSLSNAGGGATWNDGFPHVVGVTKRGSGGSGNIRRFLDGVLTGTSDWTTNDNFTDATVASRIGNDKGGAGAYWGEGISIVALFKAALTEAEMAYVGRGGLFDMIAPLPRNPRRYWVSAPAASGDTLFPQAVF